jgi:phosphoribosyl-ATP pyrophosphohydrolase/phosphoribosyl-AMP cyclohydrolase
MTRRLESPRDLDALDFAKGGGVVTVVAQDAVSGAVLMVAHADREALEKTLASGEMWYRSRTRGLWHKGATSGNIQRVVALLADCDGDAILAQVTPTGPACHTNSRTCFGAAPAHELARLSDTVAQRAASGDGGTSYTRRLLDDRNLRLKKVGEEAAELVVACADGDRERAVAECADLFYHALVALRVAGAGLDEVDAELAARRRS